MNAERVVVTGMGVVSPLGNDLETFEHALRQGRSGIRKVASLERLGFGCQVGGLPQGVEQLEARYFTEEALLSMNSHMIYAGIAGIDAFRAAGFDVPPWDSADVHWDTGAIIGTGVGGIETLEALDAEAKVKSGRVKKLGGTLVEQTMASAASSRLGGLLALGGRVTTNSSACATGTEAIADAYHHIAAGRAQRMLAGGSEGGTEHSAPFVWAGFDSMRILARGFNDSPERASRPLSRNRSGFVPAAGAGVMMLETLDSARQRGAPIWAEVLGAHSNSGGQRRGGSMTAANPEGVVRCVREAVRESGVELSEIDLINGHLTGTRFDVQEVENWQRALELPPERLPTITATKSLFGHGLGASGAWECIATVLMLKRGFVHPTRNAEDLDETLAPCADSLLHEGGARHFRVAAKASFGFGDVNVCVILRRFEES